VLLADAASARICSTDDGSATAIPALPFASSVSGAGSEREELLCRAWQRAEGRNSTYAGPAKRFALHLGQILREGAREKAYDGLVIVAAPEIAMHLDRMLAPETRARLIGEIVRDPTPIAPRSAESREELWH
jgi:protein required for attachment to host cells